MRRHLLEVVGDALASRRVPRLERSGCDSDDWQRMVQGIGPLWNTGNAPAITADPACITTVWLTREQFRFAFLRLIESSLRHPESDLASVVLEIAAEPVPSESMAPPARFSELSPDEVRIIAKCLSVLDTRNDGGQARLEGPSENAADRVVNRAVRNWTRFAADFGS